MDIGDYVVIFGEKDKIRCYALTKEECIKGYKNLKREGIPVIGVYKKMDVIDEYMLGLEVVNEEGDIQH